MAGGPEYVLKLLDKLTAPAKKMASALKGLGREQKLVQKATNEAEKAVSKMGMATMGAGNLASAGAAGLRQFAAAAKAAQVAQMRGGRLNAAGRLVDDKGRFLSGGGLPRRSFGGKLKGVPGLAAPAAASGGGGGGWGAALAGGAKGMVGDLSALNTAAGKAMSGWKDMAGAFMSTPLGMVASGVKAVGGALWDLGKYLASCAWDAAKLSYALSALAAAWVTKEVLQSAIFAERARLSFAALTGSVTKGAAAFVAARRTAMELGMGIEETSQGFIDLMAAQFTVAQSEALVKLSTDLATVTGHADAAGRAINAISKIKATGRLQGDEMMMLAEAGLSLDLVYGHLEKRFGKTREQIIKMQAAGKISAVEAIDAIQKAIMTKLHESKPGEAASRYAFSTFGGAWKQLQNAPKNFLLRVGERIDTSPLLEGMRKLVNAFNTADGGQLVGFVNQMVRALARAAELVPHFAAGFSASFDRIIKALTLGDAKGGEDTARRMGEMFGNFLAKSIELAGKLLPVIEKLATKFAEGFNVDSLVATIDKMDFAKMGEDFGVIAKGLGEIYGAAVKLIPLFGGSAQLAVKALTEPDFGGPGGTIKKATVNAKGESLSEEQMKIRSVLQPHWRGEGWLNDINRWSGGVTPETFYDPTGQTPGFEARPGEPSLRAGAGGGGQYTANVTVVGSKDPAEAARLAEKGTRRAMEQFADGPLSEAP